MEHNRTGPAKASRRHRDELTLERERLEPTVLAVGDQKRRLFAAVIDVDAVTGVELAVALASAAELTDELAFLVELVDELR
ncbi:MAG: hypothetical protein AAF085_07350, partial [Planctomycetota bacterium]